MSSFVEIPLATKTDLPQTASYQVKPEELLNGWVSPNPGYEPKFWRYGPLVQLVLDGFGIDGKDATGDAFLEVPLGFRPAGMGNYSTLGLTSSAEQIAKDFNRLRTDIRDTVDANIWWRTNDPFPA